MTEERSSKSDRPKPGSAEAVRNGCLCAVMDNNHGLYPPIPPDNWWITFGCPIHSPMERRV